MKNLCFLFVILCSLASLSVSAQSKTDDTPYYVFHENGTYGWDHEDGSIFLAKYLGMRHNVIQFSMPVPGEGNSQIAIIRPPFEFMTIVDFKNLGYVDRRVGRIQLGSVVSLMVIDAFKNKLTAPSQLFNGTNEFLWVDKNFKIKKLSRADFHAGPEL